MQNDKNLFPITLQDSGSSQNKKDSGDLSWLTNTSFKGNVQSQEPTDVCDLTKGSRTAPDYESYEYDGEETHDNGTTNTLGKLLTQVREKGFPDDIHIQYTDVRYISSASSEESDKESTGKKRKHHHSDDHEHSSKKKKKEKKNKKKHKKEKLKLYKRKYKRKFDLEREKKANMPQHHKSKIFLDEFENLDSSMAFRFDHLGDENNLAYGSLYQMHVARRSLAFRHCLVPHGSRPFYLGDRKSKSRILNERYYHKENKKQICQPAIHLSQCIDLTKHLVHHEKQGLKDQDEEFVPFLPDLQNADESARILVDSMGHEQIKAKVEFYNKNLRDQPNNIKLWKEWIDFQPRCIELTAGFERSKEEVDQRKPLQKSVRDIQLAIVEKALEKNPGSIELSLRRLELVHDWWDSERLMKKWKALLFKHPNRAGLWRSYSRMCKTHHHSFTVSSCLKAYAKCLQTLRDVADGIMTSHTALPNTHLQMLGLFSDLCGMLWCTGHTERAVAAFQAQLEFNLHCPAVLSSSPHDQRVEFLEAFWGSTAPRLGEMECDGEKGQICGGWHTWVERKGDVPAHVPWTVKGGNEEAEETLLTQYLHKHPSDGDTPSSSTWRLLETSRRQSQWLPWRPHLEEGESDMDVEDPDRMVLADDVTPYLFTVVSEELRFELVCSFLRLFQCENLIRTYSLSSCGADLLDSSDLVLQAFQSVSVIGKTKQCIYELEHVVRFVGNVLEQCASDFDGAYKSFILQAIVRLKCSQLGRTKLLSEGEQKKLYKSTKKWLKQVLKQEANRNNLLLWEALADLDWHASNRDDSLKVLHTALSLNKSKLDSLAPTDFTLEHVLICRLFIDIVEKLLSALLDNDKAKQVHHYEVCTKCERLLFCLALGEPLPSLVELNNEKLSMTNRLRAKHAFLNTHKKLKAYVAEKPSVKHKDVLMLQICGNMLTCWTTCFAYFQYCGESLISAKEVFEGTISDLKSKYHLQRDISQDSADYFERTYESTEVQRLSEAYVAICKLHVDANPVPFRLLREPLLNALEDFPTEPRLLQLYVALETKAGLSRDLRTFFHRKSSGPDATYIWLFAAVAELERIRQMEKDTTDDPTAYRVPGSSGITQQVRAWLERGINNGRSRNCALLWRIYGLFELEQGHIERAEAVLYQSLQNCPSSKALYEDVLTACPRRLVDTLDLMTEKELRMRTPYEELELLLKAVATKMRLERVEQGTEGSEKMESNT